MIREDVVDYFHRNLPAFQIEDLRRQLREEGVSDDDIEDSLSEALRLKAKPSGASTNQRRKLMLIGAGAVVAAGLVLAALGTGPRRKGGPATDAAMGESGFVGHRGWVVRLPKDYIGISDFKDASKTHQIVYFCKKDTDPTNFLNEGLYGQLGIVKLEVLPSEFPNNPAGLAGLARILTGKYTRAGEKFVMKNIQVATLAGIQVQVQAPFPRVEAFVLGEQELYFFYAGQEDEIWRDIVLSLRDAHTES